MRRVLLMGNPNVGKSVFFHRLTGVEVISSNYPGTTIEYTKGYMRLHGKKVEVIDVPGTYTLEPTCKAEEVACEILQQSIKKEVSEADLIINVIDATNLERNLYLTLELLEKGIPVVLALNMWDETKHKGIEINIEKLSDWLQVPVVVTSALSGEGFKALIDQIDQAKTPKVRKHTFKERWEDIGKVLKEVQQIKHKHHTIVEILQEATIRPLSGMIFALFVAFLSFKIIRTVAEGLIQYVFEPFFENYYAPLMMKLSVLLGPDTFLNQVLIGKIINGKIDFVQSFGVLTTGLFINITMVMPYILAFYFVLGILEDSGYLPRLAVLMDVFMHRIGLHGFAIIPTFLGLGCNVPGILATRMLESRRERFIAATLISIGVPCAALQAMIMAALGKYGARPILIVYLTLFLSWLILGFILNRWVKGFSPEIIIEIPPYRLPPLKLLLRKLWWRVKGFIYEALPITLVGILFINLLYMMNIFNFISQYTAPFLSAWLGLPPASIIAILIGFLRKDVAVSMLLPLGLSVQQLIVSCVVLSMFFPCVATFIVLTKELGWKDMLKSTAIMIFASLLAGGVLNLIL